MSEDRDTPPHGGPRLLVRTSLADIGARPLPGDYSSSPDIVALNPAPPPPHTSIHDVVAGASVQLVAVVQNLSGAQPAVAATATFWWGDPSLGLVKAPDRLIGASSPKTILAGQADTLVCKTPWIPTFVYGRYVYLIVEVQAAGYPVLHTFRPDLDGQVAQRNVWVHQA